MKETLQKLRTIEPSEDTMRAIKLRVDARVSTLKANSRPVASPYFVFTRKTSLFLVPAMAFSFLLMFGLYTNGSFEKTRMSVSLARASNAHVKSQVMLSHLQKSTQSIELAMADPRDLYSLSDTIDRTTVVLDNLKLMGEEGKYTMEECLSDYHAYYEQLEELEKSLNNAPYPTTVDQVIARNNLLSKVAQAMEEAEDRLGKYPEEK